MRLHSGVEPGHAAATEQVMFDLHTLRDELMVRNEVSAKPHRIARAGESLHQGLRETQVRRRENEAGGERNDALP